MFRDKKDLQENLKDSQKDALKDTSSTPAIYIPSGSHFGSYTKTNKLITALYMVTDIIDKDEPLRNKLRTLGTGIISDMHLSAQGRAGETASFIMGKISEIMSFLEIASAIGIVSEMNSNILKKEFLELNQSIKEATGKVQSLNRQINLSEFFAEPKEVDEGTEVRGKLFHVKGHYPAIGHHTSSTRIGVQKGDTLLKALHGIKVPSSPLKNNEKKITSSKHDFDILKKERQTQIINLIKIIGDSATIKDIKDKAQEKPEIAGSLVSCGEKTLQRELVSMVQSGVLNRMGEKRWSRYFVK
jgi:hypothetical protein